MTSPKNYYANYNHFVPNFVVVCENIQHICIPNLKSFGSMNAELWPKEFGEFSITKVGTWAFFPQHHGCRNINV